MGNSVLQYMQPSRAQMAATALALFMAFTPAANATAQEQEPQASNNVMSIDELLAAINQLGSELDETVSEECRAEAVDRTRAGGINNNEMLEIRYECLQNARTQQVQPAQPPRTEIIYTTDAPTPEPENVPASATADSINMKEIAEQMRPYIMGLGVISSLFLLCAMRNRRISRDYNAFMGLGNERGNEERSGIFSLFSRPSAVSALPAHPWLRPSDPS